MKKIGIHIYVHIIKHPLNPMKRQEKKMIQHTMVAVSL